MFQLEEYPAVARDTARNLELFAFVREHTDREDIVWAFDQFVPYVQMMNTRARASIELEKRRVDAALKEIEKGRDLIVAFYNEHEQADAEKSAELAFLDEWRDELRAKQPVSKLEKMRREMESAISQEAYERAAQLRDEIKALDAKRSAENAPACRAASGVGLSPRRRVILFSPPRNERHAHRTQGTLGAQAGRQEKSAVRSHDRLPPGQHLTNGFPVLDLGIQPVVKLPDWRLEIRGPRGKSSGSVVGRIPRADALRGRERLSLRDDLEQVRLPLVGRGVFYPRRLGQAEAGGAVRVLHELRRIFDQHGAGELPGRRRARGHAFDGKPIPKEHGGPARVIIPKLYAWKGAKFVRTIEFLAEDKPGFWEVRGYSNTADPWTDDRFA